MATTLKKKIKIQTEDLNYTPLNNKGLTPPTSRPFKFPRLPSIKKKNFKQYFTHSNMTESYRHTVKQNKAVTK